MAKTFDKEPEGSIIHFDKNHTDKKNFIYVGTSPAINKAKRDVFNTNYSIGTIISDKDLNTYKIGITKNIDTRMTFLKTEIKDFKLIKFWEINNPTRLLENFLSWNYKMGWESYGSQFFNFTEDLLPEFIDDIEYIINNTFTKKGKVWIHAYKK